MPTAIPDECHMRITTSIVTHPWSYAPVGLLIQSMIRDNKALVACCTVCCVVYHTPSRQFSLWLPVTGALVSGHYVYAAHATALGNALVHGRHTGTDGRRWISNTAAAVIQAKAAKSMSITDNNTLQQKTCTARAKHECSFWYNKYDMTYMCCTSRGTFSTPSPTSISSSIPSSRSRWWVRTLYTPCRN